MIARYFFSMILIAVLIMFSAGLLGAQTVNDRPYTIVIHGGAGDIDRAMPDSIRQAYIDALTHALKIGQDILARGGSSLDAVEQVIRYFETDPKFNAGIGAVYTADTSHELDASIMDGRDLSCGAVAAVRHIAHPVSLARLVMEKTPHILLVAGGAEEFAKTMGMDLVPSSYFDTAERLRQLLEAKKRQKEHGTVGCVALDTHGNLAAGTSTGGMTNKRPGRVGDSPLIGDGTYANNGTCAVSCTGWGEKFIKHTVAYNISALMEFKGMTLQEAANEMIYHRLDKADGGLIAVDAHGNYAMPFSTTGMFRGVASSGGTFEVKIWK